MTSESEFHEAWEKFVAPSLCPSTGVFSVVKAGTLNGTPTAENQQVSWYRWKVNQHVYILTFRLRVIVASQQ